MHGIGYACPDSLEGVLALLASSEGAALPLAGGTALVPRLRWRETKDGCAERRDLTPQSLVSLRMLTGLYGVSDEGDYWRIGSMTRLKSLTRTDIGTTVPLLGAVAEGMASPEIRNVATLGGNLCNGSPAADLLGPACALDGRVRLVSLSGERVLSMDQFYQGPHRVALVTGEIMAALEVSKAMCSAAWGHSAYATRPRMGMTLASASLVLVRESEDAIRARLAVALASGRLTLLDLTLPDDLRAAQTRMEDALRPALEKQASRIAACHYAKENPQVPAWYVARRAVIACQEALTQAWGRASSTGGER